MGDPQTTTETSGPPGASKIDLWQVPALIDGAIAIGLAGAGLALVYVAETKDRPQWGGFVLIGLAVLLYMMRGQVITKLSLGKEGVALDTARAALSKAQEAAATATQNSQIIDQQLAAGGKSRARAEPEVAGQLDWSHPALTKARKGKRVVDEDPQSGQWGGKFENNGRLLDAEYAPAKRGWVNVTLKVTSTDPKKPLTRPVRFHLHDTFHPSVDFVKPKDGVAETCRLAWGAFTVGAEVANEPDSYLELDLAKDPDAPEGWKNR